MTFKKCKKCGNEISDTLNKCPICGTALNSHSGLITIIGLLILIGASGSFFGESGSKSIHDSPKQLAYSAVDISTILSSYKNNEVGGDNKYKGRPVQVSGVVFEIKKDILDKPYIILCPTHKRSYPAMHALFDSSANNKLAALNKGDSVVVAGVVDGLMFNVLLKDCELK